MISTPPVRAQAGHRPPSLILFSLGIPSGPFMKHLILAIALVVPAYAGASELPREVSLQWAKYQAALKANDLPALTSMAKFPLHCNEFKGDIKSAKEFAQDYKVIFPEPTKRCLETSVLHPRKSSGRIH